MGTGPAPPSLDDRRRGLRADCARCAGLCCVAPAFAASADFAIDKPAGRPCPNLEPGFRCGIHDRLRRSGFPGCAAYDCFGAGQQVTQVAFAGLDWRRAPELAGQMFTVFGVVRQLHELRWYLTEALTLQPARRLHGALRAALDETERLGRGSPDALADLDLTAHRRTVDDLLLRTSELVRARARRRHVDHRGADLMGRDLRAADLSGADLRGAYLIGADLRHADLTTADLIGADLRGARLDGADLTGSLFLVQARVEAAHGDHRTRLPAVLDRPAHWQPPAARRR